MGYMVFDTETSGLPLFKEPADHPGQPKLASFAAILLDDDEEITDRVNFYVKPDGWTMPAEAAAVHGLTDEFLHENGIPLRQVLDFYTEAVLSGRVMVAYNAQFDLKIMRGELRRSGMPDHFEQTRNICVMRPMTDLCKLPGRYGYKWPKLAEAMAYFGRALEGAHQADNDAEGALIVFRELRKRGLLPQAAVHYAKDKPIPTKASVAQAASSSGFPDAF